MNDQALRTLAQNLYSGYQKDTIGHAAKLSDADSVTQQLWLRAARRAVKIIAKLSDPHDPAKAGTTRVPRVDGPKTVN